MIFNETGEYSMPKSDPKEHTLERAEYFSGLVSKTTDPVYWPAEKILAAVK